ncbi:potassium voltage-gated channel protein Shaw-like [Physella acuta]|uniref:potassium voltage-gated channel protein Shaw-like n=1 Tax=Physella acuta TaxID=109671 RepID=UPI0027DDFD7C|nr:potassium voltage-gated channel protein Shaw-like [Physella acuta]
MGGAEASSTASPVRHYVNSSNVTPTRRHKILGDTSDDERILLNVGGVRHETHVTTLKNVPNSRLSRLAALHTSSGKGKQEYFFDRHPAVFNSIIDFYRTGELHVPLEVCGAVVKRELDFWQIEELQIKACCWRHYRSYIENQRILNSFNKSLEHEQMKVDLSNLKGWRHVQMKLWLIMDHPRTSRLAMLYGITSFLFVATSIAGFCLETLPDLRPTQTNITNATCSYGNDNKTVHVALKSNDALNVLDFICTIFFSLELVLRFVVSPGKFKFIRNIMNIIDLLALVPLYVQVIFEHSELHESCYLNERFVFEIMFTLRIFRMFRIFHLVKHYQALKVLVYALRASLQELMMLFIFLLLATLIFATMIYYAERDAINGGGTKFTTIPIGFWWAIITMTTVGYGDITPSSPIGYIVGTACAVCGVLLVALTFPVISNNFTLFYEHVRSRSLSPRVKTFQEDAESEDEEETDTFSPPQHPDYGAVLLKMQTLTSANTNGATNGSTNGAAAAIASSAGEDSKQGNGMVKTRYVPLAKFCDTSSMMDIILQEPTEELYGPNFTPPTRKH